MSSVHFIKSAVHPADYPEDTGVEIAFAGRSNAGKSTLINLLTGRKQLAKVSGTPGKTRLLNFFEVAENYRWVDLPGYGYAARSGSEMESWGQMIETYLQERQSLGGLLLIQDIRRKWTEDEELLKAFANQIGYPLAVVLSKADKVSSSERGKAIKAVQKASGVLDVFAVSSLKKEGYHALEEFIYNEWVKPRLEEME